MSLEDIFLSLTTEENADGNALTTPASQLPAQEEEAPNA
jgi:hypothetical protein